MSAKAARQFLDTNVFVYAHDMSAGPKYGIAKSLVIDLWGSQLGCLSTQVLQEFYVTITRKAERPLASEAAALIVADLSTWRVHTPGIADVLAAIEIHRRYGISYWDALIIHSASQLGCGVVWSEDLNPGQVYAGVRILSPFAGG